MHRSTIDLSLNDMPIQPESMYFDDNWFSEIDFEKQNIEDEMMKNCHFEKRRTLMDECQQLQENKEKRLWKKVNVPCSLYDTINGLTKAEMDIIRRNYDFKNLSALKKADLATELARLIPLILTIIWYRNT